jgi:hypothetical protein
VEKREFGEARSCAAARSSYTTRGWCTVDVKYVSRATRARARLRGKTVVPSMVLGGGSIAVKGRERGALDRSERGGIQAWTQVFNNDFFSGMDGTRGRGGGAGGLLWRAMQAYGVRKFQRGVNGQEQDWRLGQGDHGVVEHGKVAVDLCLASGASTQQRGMAEEPAGAAAREGEVTS